MASFMLCVLALLLAAFGSVNAVTNVPFGENFKILFGEDHTLLSDHDRQIQISIDKSSGSGFQSLQKYMSGFFSMNIKLPVNDPESIVKTFYLISDHNDSRHEIDFEFLAKRDGRYLLHTNIISTGNLHREEEFALWFDPTADFHNYTILWNNHQLALFVDSKPVRVLENTGIYKDMFLTKQMYIEATIWDGQWVTSKPVVNWTGEPFKAQYRDFDIHGCPYTGDSSSSDCYSPVYWWNLESFWSLNEDQKQDLDSVRKNYMVLDYCDDRNPPPECNK